MARQAASSTINSVLVGAGLPANRPQGLRKKKPRTRPGRKEAADESAGQPFVVHVAGLALRAPEGAAGLQHHLGADADVGLDLAAQLTGQLLALRLVQYLAFTA